MPCSSDDEDSDTGPTANIHDAKKSKNPRKKTGEMKRIEKKKQKTGFYTC